MELMRTAADLQRLYFRINAHGSEIFIPVPQYGVTFLLGKNGAGKTSLLNGLGKMIGTPGDHHFEVSVLTANQSSVSKEVWDDFFANRRDDDGSMTEWSESAPRLIECINQYRTNNSIRLPKNFNSSGFDVATTFGFHEAEISPSVSKHIGFVFEQPNPIAAAQDTWRLPSSLDVYLDPAWILLESLSLSTTQISDASDEYFIVCQESTDPSIWLDDANKRQLLGVAFRQFCNSLKIEWRISNDKLQLRYVTELPHSGPLHSVLELLNREIETLAKKLAGGVDPNAWNGVYKFFPHDLFHQTTLPSGPAIATAWRTVAANWRCFGWFDTGGWLFDKLSISDVSQVDEALKTSEEAFIKRHITNSKCEIEDDKISIEFTGITEAIDAIAILSEDFRSFDIGIASLELHLEKPDLAFLLEDGFELPIKISIRWKDAVDGVLRPLTEASDGQKVIMSTILALSAQDRSANGLLLVDEFDRALHPTAAKALAGLIDAVLQRSDGIGILSTHNPSLTTVTDNDNWYTSRDALGRFAITSSLGDTAVASQEMGIDELDAYRLKKLIVLGEGMHEDIILGKLFASDNKISDAIWFMTSNGINNYSLAWHMSLRLFSMPVLMIYDKKDERLEKCLVRLRQLQHSDDPWTASGLQQLEDDLRESKAQAQRDGAAPPDGHHELGKMLVLMKDVIDHGGSDRLLIHGIDVPDIVDCLDPKFFRNVTSWESAHDEAKKKRLNGEAFKKLHKIDRARIEKALNDPDFTWHPELQNVYSRISTLLGLEDFDF
jgi:predicted ATPase